MSYISPEIPVMSTFDTFDSFAFPVKTLNHFDQELLQSYKDAFDSFDSNHNGRVSSSHLQVKKKIQNTYPDIFNNLEPYEKGRSKPNRHRSHGNYEQN